MEPLTTDIILVLLMIGVAIFLFIVEWLRVDVVAILVMVTLPLLGLVSPKETFSGLSSNAVVSIIAVIIIGAGLDKTGVVNNLVAPVIRLAGNSANRVIIAISLTVAVISSFMQNIGAAALFLPAIQRISKTLKIPISKLLMPIGFSAILGGTVTLVGSSPLILLNDLIIPFNLEPFGLFDVTPMVLTLVVSGILCFVLLGRFILPKGTIEQTQENKTSENKSTPSDESLTWELHTPEDFTHYRDPIHVEDLRKHYLVNVVGIIELPDFKVISPPGDMEIHSNVDLVVHGQEKDVQRMAETEGMTLKEDIDVFSDELSDQNSGTVEAVVAPRSNLNGKSLKETDFQERSGISPLSINRHGDVYRSKISEMPLKVGDVILLHGPWKKLHYLEKDRNLLFATPIEFEAIKKEKALLAGFWLAVALSMIIIFKIQLSVCLMTGALGMIITRVLSIDEAYQAVDWRTVFLLAGLIPLGLATEKTGAAAWIAHTVLNTIGDVPSIVLIAVIGVLTTFFTLVISNVGATVLLIPLVVNLAVASNTDPRMAVLAVGMAASNSFILPTHQVNALYMGPGGYRSVDFIKAGTVVSIIFLMVMVTFMYLVYGI